jgi:bacteriocin leader peptide (microcyclamide/patellamide family)
MNKKNISPNPLQPIDRVPTGQLPSALAELSEEAIGEQALASMMEAGIPFCSYDGDDE